eukprot:4036542-Pyramimonas_sp.AAC.1
MDFATSGEIPDARAAAQFAALTGRTGVTSEAVAARTEREEEHSRPAASPSETDNRLRIPCAGEKSHPSFTEEVDAQVSPGVTNLVLRLTLPPSPDHKQLRPEEQDPPWRTGNASRAA